MSITVYRSLLGSSANTDATAGNSTSYVHEAACGIEDATVVVFVTTIAVVGGDVAVMTVVVSTVAEVIGMVDDGGDEAACSSPPHAATPIVSAAAIAIRTTRLAMLPTSRRTYVSH